MAKAKKTQAVRGSKAKTRALEAPKKAATKKAVKKTRPKPPKTQRPRSVAKRRTYATEKMEAKQAMFLDAFLKLGSITEAAWSVGMSRDLVYDWLRSQPNFKRIFEDVKIQYLDLMETECDRRARHGIEEPVFYKGEVCGHKLRYSDTLMMFRLKALAPDKYKERVDLSSTIVPRINIYKHYGKKPNDSNG